MTSIEPGDRVAMLRDSPLLGPQIFELTVVRLVDDEHALVRSPRGGGLLAPLSLLTPLPKD